MIAMMASRKAHQLHQRMDWKRSAIEKKWSSRQWTWTVCASSKHLKWSPPFDSRRFRNSWRMTRVLLFLFPESFFFHDLSFCSLFLHFSLSLSSLSSPFFLLLSNPHSQLFLHPIIIGNATFFSSLKGCPFSLHAHNAWVRNGYYYYYGDDADGDDIWKWIHFLWMERENGKKLWELCGSGCDLTTWFTWWWSCYFVVREDCCEKQLKVVTICSCLLNIPLFSRLGLITDFRN